ncbi:phosphohydrolase [Candidatus Gottesmanbacteria bacterium]|nr:phosphohydrolase [Candidatus Gottesmanbacteria bacterium]
MLNRGEAIKLIEEHVFNKNIVKHMLATEALMAGVYDELKSRGKSEEELGGTRGEWMTAGLLHDGDYCESVPKEKQGVQIVDWARQKGYEVPENVVHAMAAHNWNSTGIEPKSLMDWTIFMGDSLTGLMVATTLVLPSKKLSEVTPEMVLRRFKEPKFAAGTRRDDIALCQEKIGLSLEEFVKVCLQAMQKISNNLGL